jgi:hypothetical protein
LGVRAPLALPHGPNERCHSISCPTASAMAGAFAF